MSQSTAPSSVGEGFDLEQYDRIRRIYDMEDWERSQIPVRDYVRHSPEHVPSILETR